MYFDENEVKNFLNILTDRFDKFTLYLDLLSKKLVKQARRHDTLKTMKNAEFKWGVKDGSEVVKLRPGSRANALPRTKTAAALGRPCPAHRAARALAGVLPACRAHHRQTGRPHDGQHLPHQLRARPRHRPASVDRKSVV